MITRHRTRFHADVGAVIDDVTFGVGVGEAAGTNLGVVADWSPCQLEVRHAVQIYHVGLLTEDEIGLSGP